jgi:hypothetical protein
MTPAWPVLLLAALASGPGPAHARELLDAPACRRAMDTLDAREAAAAKDRAARPAWESARRQAALACLGGRDRAASAVRRAAQPSFTTPPARPGVPITIPVPTPSAAPPAVPRPAPPLTVTACDATGCWASDGSRLQRVGPNLLGPQGQACSTSGTLLHCTR